jgi:hypothetical protein
VDSNWHKAVSLGKLHRLADKQAANRQEALPTSLADSSQEPAQVREKAPAAPPPGLRQAIPPLAQRMDLATAAKSRMNKYLHRLVWVQELGIQSRCHRQTSPATRLLALALRIPVIPTAAMSLMNQ